jgi:hypothetical protein
VDRADVPRLYYITAIANLPSIIALGVLSHSRAARVAGHVSIANQEVQDRRAGKRVPNGLMLHDYANFYINARNAMLFSLLDDHCDEMCVLGLAPELIDLPDVVVTDGNAAVQWVTFRPAAEGLQRLDRDVIFLRYWPDPDPIVEERQRQAMQAEVLIPHQVPAQFVSEARVANATARKAVSDVGFALSCRIDRYMFFNRG